jgi:hypothetical protein
MVYQKIAIWRSFLPKTNYFSHQTRAYPPSVPVSGPPLRTQNPRVSHHFVTHAWPRTHPHPAARRALLPHIAPLPSAPCRHQIAGTPPHRMIAFPLARPSRRPLQSPRAPLPSPAELPTTTPPCRLSSAIVPPCFPREAASPDELLHDIFAAPQLRTHRRRHQPALPRRRRVAHLLEVVIDDATGPVAPPTRGREPCS